MSRTYRSTGKTLGWKKPKKSHEYFDYEEDQPQIKRLSRKEQKQFNRLRAEIEGY